MFLSGCSAAPKPARLVAVCPLSRRREQMSSSAMKDLLGRTPLVDSGPDKCRQGRPRFAQHRLVREPTRSPRRLDGTKQVSASCIMHHFWRGLNNSACRRCGAGESARHFDVEQRLPRAGFSRELARSLGIESYILHRASLTYRLNEPVLCWHRREEQSQVGLPPLVSRTAVVACSPRRGSRASAERLGKRRW